jgi:hypothetical protein
VNVVAEGWDDGELLAALQQALRRRQAVPPEFVAAGRNAFAWHNIDAELAQLTYDSVRGPGSVARTRSESASIRALTFTSASLTVELEVTQDGLLGQVVPAQAATIAVQDPAGGQAELATDEVGCFTIDPVPGGPFRLRCRAAGSIDVLTGWITL